MNDKYRNNDACSWAADSPALTEAEVIKIIRGYHRKRMAENATGPMASFAMHALLLALLYAFVSFTPRRIEPSVVVELAMIDDVELEPEVIEEIILPDEKDQEAKEKDELVDEMTKPEVGEAEVVEESLVDVSDQAPMTDEEMETPAVMDVLELESALRFRSAFGGRSSRGRRRLVRKYGGTERGQRAVENSMKWLARVQNPNGSWGAGDGDPAHTGLAALVFLAHGETPMSETYGKTVEGAMRWLADYAADDQMKTSRAYSHGIATYAIAESYSMTRIPTMETAMEAAVQRIIDGQQNNGGFDYYYRKTDRWDVSVTAWQAQALKAAQVAGSKNEKLKGAIVKCISFLRGEAFDGSGKFMYSTGKENPTVNLTGAGVVGLQLLGAGRTAKSIGAVKTVSEIRIKDYKKVLQAPAEWRHVAGERLYGWYYDTQAVFNAQDDAKGKKQWREWRSVFEKVLTRAQHPQGYWETSGKHKIGSPNTPGRVLATCFCSLQLQVYYRYLPTFDIEKMDAVAEQSLDLADLGIARGGALIIDID